MLDPLSLSIPFDHVPPRPVGPTRKLLKPSSSHPDDYIMELDYSSSSTIMECKRKAENILVRSRQFNGEGAATSFGRCFHECEELRLRHGLSDAVRQKQRETVMHHFLLNPVGAGEYRTGDRLLQVLDLYNERYAHDQWPERILQVDDQPVVERAFKVPLCTIPVNSTVPYSLEQLCEKQDRFAALDFVKHPFVRNLHIVFTGRIDAILQDSGHLWVVDHKTSSRGGKEFLEAFRLSLQTRGYTWAATKLLGRKVSGLIMNAVVVRPITRTGTGTEFDRHYYTYEDWSLREWEQNMIAVLTEFVSCLARGYFPQLARSFKSPCAGCDFADNCTLPPEQRATDLATDLYTDCTWNPITLGEAPE